MYIKKNIIKLYFYTNNEKFLLLWFKLLSYFVIFSGNTSLFSLNNSRYDWLCCFLCSHLPLVISTVLQFRATSNFKSIVSFWCLVGSRDHTMGWTGQVSRYIRFGTMNSLIFEQGFTDCCLCCLIHIFRNLSSIDFGARAVRFRHDSLVCFSILKFLFQHFFKTTVSIRVPNPKFSL